MSFQVLIHFVRPVLLGLIACGLIGTSHGSDRWWKGNLHTHSLWSDGDEYPEVIVAWYKQNGYHFLSLSDHNKLLEGETWCTATTNRGGGKVLEKYVSQFGSNWVQTRLEGDQVKVRLRTLEEFRGKFEERGRFLLIPGEEISDKYKTAPIHVNVSNIRELIPPQGGDSVQEVMQKNIDAVLAQRKRTGQPMIPHLNHPNFEWAITAEDMLPLKGEKFFEVYNGHPGVRNYGDAHRAGTDRIWDILLTRRLAELNLEPIWATAVDDAHNYQVFGQGAYPGRGWIMVRASALTPERIIEAMEKGDFYASSGVTIKEIRRSSSSLSLEIEPEAGVTYMTQFIGTRKGYDPSSEPVVVDGKEVRTTRRYTKDIGAVLAEVPGNKPSYRLKGDEIYVRAKVISSRLKNNPFVKGEYETAWVQPLITGRK